MGFSRQEYWSGLPFPSPGNLPDPGIEPACPASPASQADSLPAEPLGRPLKNKAESSVRSLQIDSIGLGGDQESVYLRSPELWVTQGEGWGKG